MAGTSLAKRAETAQRRTEAIEMAKAGRTWVEIADELGYSSRGAAYTDVQRAMQHYVAEQQEGLTVLRAEALAHLDALREVAWQILAADHPLVQGGKAVTMEVTGPDGVMVTVPLKDLGPKFAAMDRLLKIEERRARYLGTETPVRVQAEATVQYQIVGFDMSQLR